jgi:hypothetical protein
MGYARTNLFNNTSSFDAHAIRQWNGVSAVAKVCVSVVQSDSDMTQADLIWAGMSDFNGLTPQYLGSSDVIKLDGLCHIASLNSCKTTNVYGANLEVEHKNTLSISRLLVII